MRSAIYFAWTARAMDCVSIAFTTTKTIVLYRYFTANYDTHAHLSWSLCRRLKYGRSISVFVGDISLCRVRVVLMVLGILKRITLSDRGVT
eukprot:9498864-Pyramimonas_sp.AAC.1